MNVQVEQALPPPQPAQQVTVPASALGGSGRSAKMLVMLMAAAVFGASLFLSTFRSSQTIDINSDEASYAIQSVALYQTGETRWAGQPFFVHPPLFFAAESVYYQFLGVGTSQLFRLLASAPLPVGEPLLPADASIPADNVFNAIMAGRQLVALYAALLAAAVFLLGRMLGSTRLGLAAALLFLIDPYVARRNHFNMLEPLTTLFGLLMTATYFHATNQHSLRRKRWLLLLTGVFLGLALLSKELAIVYVPPMVIYAVVFKRLRSRELVPPLLTSAAIYAVFPLWTWLNGDLPTWLSTRVWLYERISGMRNDAGIGRPGTTVTRSISASLIDYWPSFVLLGLAGLLAVLVVYLYARGGLRDRPAELLTSFVLGIYGIFLVIWRLGGVINEQFFYLVMPLTILSVAYLLLTWARLMNTTNAVLSGPAMGDAGQTDQTPRGVPAWSGRGSLVARVSLAALLGMCCYNAYTWVVRYGLGSDDSYAMVEAQLANSLPAGAAVIARDVTDVLMLPKNVVYWYGASPETFMPRGIVQQQVDYAILNDQDLVEGYAGANQLYYDFVRQYGQPIRQFAGRRWTTAAYRIDYTRVASNPPLGRASLATGKPSFASATAGDAYLPAYAFDGNFASRWASPRLDDAWISVDLGQSLSFERVELTWEAAFAQDYQLQVSHDAENWTTFYQTDQGNGGYEIVHARAQGRYVRLLMSKRGTRFGYSLWEIEIRPTDVGPLAPGAVLQAPAAEPVSPPSGTP